MDVLAPTEIVVWYLVRNTFVLTYFETIYFYVTTKHKKRERKTKLGNPRRLGKEVCIRVVLRDQYFNLYFYFNM